MPNWKKIAESQHKMLIGVTIMLIIILIMLVESSISITKTMKEKDQKIEEIKNKIYSIG